MKWGICLQLSSKFIGILFQIYWNLFFCSIAFPIHPIWFQLMQHTFKEHLTTLYTSWLKSLWKLVQWLKNVVHKVHMPCIDTIDLYLLELTFKLPFVTLSCLDSCSNNDSFPEKNIALTLFGTICIWVKTCN
jgi:hypothetical protein